MTNEYDPKLTALQYMVVLYGYATWQVESDPDYAIWTARIENDRVAEWRIYADTEENKRRFDLV